MKKIILFSTFFFICIFALQTPVMADVTCAALDSDVLIDESIVDLIHTIIIIIQVVVPILLVIFGMIDLAKGVMAQKEDEIKKGQQTFIKRLIAAAIVFFVIAIVKLLISLVAKDNDGLVSCVDCFLSGSGSESCETSDTRPNDD